jgi:hypothetical protein
MVAVLVGMAAVVLAFSPMDEMAVIDSLRVIGRKW